MFLITVYDFYKLIIIFTYFKYVFFILIIFYKIFISNPNLINLHFNIFYPNTKLNAGRTDKVLSGGKVIQQLSIVSLYM